ncbi:PREDICTED: protein takeout-like [Dufourea novaeangliae]|uniref:Protein takeout n=1 Tax=Dufourea novaeangliae TaxID=178035 RepID=A0A154PNI7_DUFNO|nr:PREDICTED: protein takeout-like [Dufourea novaeangliae]KZC13441.1 Protein takeout [Dufourea novaeangliae]
MILFWFPAPYLKVCHRNDPDLNDCIKESINLLTPHLKDGIESLRLPAFEPLCLPEVEINQASGPIYIHSKYTNISIFGGTDAVPKTVKVDLDKNLMRLKFYIPRLRMITNYDLTGRIMMLPISGNGMGHGNFTDIDVIITLQMERYRSEEMGQFHRRVNDIYVDFEMGHATIYLDNLFDGDQTLSGAMNLFLNDNWRAVIAEIKPKLEETIGVFIKDFTNRIFAVFPEDALLLP